MDDDEKKKLLEHLVDLGEVPDDTPVKDLATEATPDEKAQLREILKDDTAVIIHPEAEEQMKKLGITKEEIIAMLLKEAGGLH